MNRHFTSIETLCLALLLVVVSVAASYASPDDDVAALNASDPAKSHKAAISLSQTRPDDAIPALLRGLNSTDPAQRVAALRVFRNFRGSGEDIVGNLASKGKADSDARVRLEFVMALRTLRNAAAVRGLKSFAQSDADEQVRWLATAYVGIRTNGQDQAFFKSQLNDKSLLVRLAAMKELARAGDSSYRDLAVQTISKSQRLDERTEAIGVVGASANPQDLGMLEALMKSPQESNRIRYEALHARNHIRLMQLPADQQLSVLKKSLQDSAQAERMWAAKELSRRGGQDTQTLLKTTAQSHQVGSIDAQAVLDDQ